MFTLYPFQLASDVGVNAVYVCVSSSAFFASFHAFQPAHINSSVGPPIAPSTYEPYLADLFAKSAKSEGIGVIIAGAGGAAHVAGVVAGMTTVPVIGVPIQTKALGGMDSLLSIVQMPAGIPVATMAINGAKNAGLFAAQILALTDEALSAKLDQFRAEQTQKVLDSVI